MVAFHPLLEVFLDVSKDAREHSSEVTHFEGFVERNLKVRISDRKSFKLVQILAGEVDDASSQIWRGEKAMSIVD